MYKNLPDTLLIERSMMHRMETSGAVLQYKPQFLQTLARTKESAPSLEGFEADLKRQEKVQRQEMAKSIEWITEKIDKLKMSPFVKHPVVEHTIERAERSKNSEDNLPPVILLNSIIVNLQFAVSAVAAFGNDPLFEGWVEIGIAKIDPNGRAPKFPKNLKGLIPVENRWELAEQIGHGVDCWQVSPLSTGPNGKQSTPPAVYLLYGCFEKFIFLSRVEKSDMMCQIEFNMKCAIKLLRLHNETTEALARYRRKGEQKVVVQHVNVNEGGKAIVGNMIS